MKTVTKPLPADRALKLEQWLRRRLVMERWQQLFEAMIFLALGTGILAVAYCVLLLATYMALEDVDEWVMWLEFFALMAVIFTGSYLTKARAEYSGGKSDARFSFAGLGEMFFGAPAQFRVSINCMEKCLRLWRCDVARVGVILLWLFDLRRKAAVEEICAGLSGDDSVRILPQLRDISGVIWLTYHRGVIMLSGELRREIATALKESMGPTLAEEEPAGPEEEKPIGAKETRSKEIFGWYGTMNLPPFAPLSAVRKRYRELVKIYHPDAMAGRKPGAKINSDEQIKRINAAYHNIVENSKRVRR